MNQKLRNFFAGAAALLTVGMVQTAQATHVQGGDMTYSCVAPGVYSVSLKLYRDCSSNLAINTATLNLKSPGCNTGRNVNMNLVTARIGNPYCAAIPINCTTTGLTNYEETTFTSTVIFTATEQACSEWLLSWSVCCRPSTANLVGQAEPWQEAMINLTPGINNNSPEFSPLNVPIPFVNFNQPIQISLNATEPDGDSLVYSLVTPNKASNTPVPYKSYAATMLYNSDSTKYALAPAGTFTSAFPVFSFYADWTQPMPITPIQKFMFDTRSGSLGFIPSYYDPNATSASGINKYALVVQIDEYRNVNGAMLKIGSIRRDMLINVIDCGPNQNPNINSPVVNGQAISESDIITLRPGTPMNMQFGTQDANATDILNLTSDIASILPGAVFTKTTGNRPTASITWTPTASDVRNTTYYFHVNVEDDACPVKGYQTHTFGVRVSNTGGVTGTKELTSAPRFVAYPNPFRDEVSFKVNITRAAGEHLVIYNLLGQPVDRIDLKGLASGEQTVTWKKAAKMANGQYVARLFSNQKETQTIRFSKMQ